MKSEKEKIILVGGGGHCKVIIDILEFNGYYSIAGISDIPDKKGSIISGYNIEFSDLDLERIYDKITKNAVISIGSIGDLEIRKIIYDKLKKIGFHLPKIISKQAIISKFSTISDGTVVMPGVIINSGTDIGKFCIVNTGSIIEHDCEISNNVHIAPGVTISGGVKIGETTHIGTGAIVIQGIKIGNNSVIGAGSVVVKNIGDNVVAYGNPAKVVRIL